MYCFRKRHLLGSMLHASHSIPLRFYLELNAINIWGRSQKFRVRPYYIGYMTGGVGSWE